MNYEDKAWHRESKPYIYTKKFNWFIGWWLNEDEAKEHCPKGYRCELYTTTQQIQFSGFN